MLDETDARILMELDQLYKRMDYSPKERLHLLNKHKEIIATRDDLYLEYATLLNLTGEYEQAMQLIDQRQFHPWEGGEGKVPAQYQYARIQLAKKSLKAGEYEHALALIEECLSTLIIWEKENCMVHKKMISFIIKDAFWKQWVIMMKHIHHSQKLLRAMDNPQLPCTTMTKSPIKSIIKV